MLWKTLWNRLGKLPLRITQHNHVYAILENSRTGRLEHVRLCLKFDTSGKPYFVKE